MIDFFYMSDEQRQRIFDAYHGGPSADHGHGWFEETGNQDYWSWVGESFMGGFIQAYTDEEISLDSFHHRSPEEIGPKIRKILTPYFASVRSGAFHDSHKGRAEKIFFPDRQSAVVAGYRPCRICKP